MEEQDKKTIVGRQEMMIRLTKNDIHSLVTKEEFAEYIEKELDCWVEEIHYVIGDFLTGGVQVHATVKPKATKALKIYFASPLFSLQDKIFNESLYETLVVCLADRGILADIYLPQLNEAINDKEAYASAEDILEADCNELRSSDLMIALLDGEDSGVALETGIAHERGIPLVGLWTDSRQSGGTNQKKLDAVKEIGQNQFMYINLMLSGAYLASEGIYSDIPPFVDKVLDVAQNLLKEKAKEDEEVCLNNMKRQTQKKYY